MKITAIQPQRRHPERFNVHVDGEYRLALAVEIVLRHALREGSAVTEPQLRALEQEDLRWKAREAALSLLSYRARSASELRRRLLRKDYPAEVVEQCVSDLEQRGMVDDSQFAESFVRDRVRFKPRGRRRLVQELRAKGVDPETAADAVGEVMEREDVTEVELAREAAARWSPRSGEEPLRARRRLYGFLARRGFGADAIRQVMQEVDFSPDA